MATCRSWYRIAPSGAMWLSRLMEDDALKSRVETLMPKLPQWLRHDLSSNDRAARERAEDALVAMILAAVRADSGT